MPFWCRTLAAAADDDGLCLLHSHGDKLDLRVTSLWNYDLTRRITGLESNLTSPSWLDLTQTFVTWSHDFCLDLFNECTGCWTLHAHIGLTYIFFEAVTLFCCIALSGIPIVYSNSYCTILSSTDPA